MSDLHAQTDKSIFISYSRTDRKFARGLRRKLKKLGFKLWRDVEDMPIGEKWWLSIQEAIRESNTIVLCMSPAGLKSPNVADEWHYARELGKRVMPVVAADVNFSTVPRWMSRVDWADFRPTANDTDLVWARFINQLNRPYEPRKVPFMVEPLPPDFVQRPTEFEPLVKALVDETHRATAISAALKGAGGFGKTTLARAVCHDRRIRAAFDDGILWATLGEKITEGNLTNIVLDLVVKLTGTRPPVTSLDAARDELRKAISDRYILLVIDDVWQPGHLATFQVDAEHYAVLITTRNSGVLPPEAFRQDVDAMKSNEALTLLRYKLPLEEEPALRALAARLGEWPLLLKLANGALRKRTARKQTLTQAIEWIARALSRKGFEALADADDKDQRHRAASATLRVSLELLDNDQQARYELLGIFPEDTNIPLETLEKLWNCDDFEVEEVCQRFADLSLLLAYDLSTRTIRLHDVIRLYLRETNRNTLTGWNGTFLDAYRLDNWSKLPSEETYLWRWLVYHLHEAGRTGDLRRLRMDYRWVRTKLLVTDCGNLLADYAHFTGDYLERLIYQALLLSANALVSDKRQLASQLASRLNPYRENPEIDVFLSQLEHEGFQPLNTSHRPPGDMLLRTLVGHTEMVWGALELTDGRLLSWGDDRMLQLWDSQGQPLHTLAGHTKGVRGALELADGRLLSWSEDRTLRLWDSQGQPLYTLTGHLGHMRGALELTDGRLLSWGDSTPRLWDSQGQPLHTLVGHTGMVWGALELTDGRLLSWGDSTLWLWDNQGHPLHTLVGHTEMVWGALELTDGRLLSWGGDRMLQLWDSQGQPLHTLAGHTDIVRGALELADARLLSWADDRTLRLWDSQGQPLHTLTGHTKGVRGALELTDGRLLSWAMDSTPRLWDSQGQPLHTLTGHTDIVRGALELADARLLSWSEDRTLRLWDSQGQPLHNLTGHTKDVWGALELADGQLLSWAMDSTPRLWDSQGQPLHALTGHTKGVRGTLELADGRFLSWGNDSTLRLWDSQGQPLHTLTGHTDIVRGALELSDGRLLSWSEDRTLRLWDSQGQPLCMLMGHRYSVYGALELSDGRLLSWSEDRTLRLWASRGKSLGIITKHTNRVEGALELTDGRLLSWADSTLSLWDSQGHPLHTLTGHIRNVRGALELSDGRLLSWGDEGILRLWDSQGQPLHTLVGDGALELTDGRLLSWADSTLSLWDSQGHPLHTLTGHIRNVHGALELSDGRLLSWGDEGILRLWDSQGQPLHTLTGHTRNVHGALELTDGRLLSWGYDGTLRLWDTKGSSLAAFYGDAPITCCTISNDHEIIAAGDTEGHIIFLRLMV